MTLDRFDRDGTLHFRAATIRVSIEREGAPAITAVAEVTEGSLRISSRLLVAYDEPLAMNGIVMGGAGLTLDGRGATITLAVAPEPEPNPDGCLRPFVSDGGSIGQDWCLTHHGRWRLDRPRCGMASLVKKGPKPTPHELWEQAKGDGDEYRRLMIEHGHLIPGTPDPDRDIFGHPRR